MAKTTRTKTLISDAIDSISVRMYCMGTGDCFLLTFHNKQRGSFKVLIDCGCCKLSKEKFTPYVQHLAKSINYELDLLIVTHEHNDHVNGFDKCDELFERITIKQAWFAWTEDPADPTGNAAELKVSRDRVRGGLRSGIEAIKKIASSRKKTGDNMGLISYHDSFIEGLNGLAEINLGAPLDRSESLPGMEKIKKKLKSQNTIIRYLYPGETINFSNLPGINFHVLGPPSGRGNIYKHAREGSDIYNKTLSLAADVPVANAFDKLNLVDGFYDIPFSEDFLSDKTDDNFQRYSKGEWRSIDADWLNSVGSLALRLNSHINNTSLALAIESNASGKVLLFPGDAEYGSWESWHQIDGWRDKGKNGQPFAEELLNRTVFYKVSHHFSHNGTALEKGIRMMNSGDLTVMGSLDLTRIIPGWSRTMPAKLLLEELIRRTNGKVIMMNENGINKELVPKLRSGISRNEIRKEYLEKGKLFYLEYTVGGL